MYKEKVTKLGRELKKEEELHVKHYVEKLGVKPIKLHVDK